MEEEIIGNRWKELDYDGYCLRSPYSLRSPFTGEAAPKGVVNGTGERIYTVIKPRYIQS